MSNTASTTIPLPQRAAADDLFGVDRVNAALERAGSTPRLNSDELAALASASSSGTLRVWFARLPEQIQDGVVLALVGATASSATAAPSIRVTQTYPAPLIARADALAAREGQSRAAIMRRALAAGLHRLGA